MAHFTTAGKSWSDGALLDGFASIDHTSSGDVGHPDSLSQTAPDSVIQDGVTKRFLFWDTGRQITNKRKVIWTFRYSANWLTWNAVAWYGTPSDKPGQPIIDAEPYWANNGPLTSTAIHDVTEAGVPAGHTAWPWMSNDHQVRTEWGAGSIGAKDTLTSTTGTTLDFSGWLKLQFGGDPTGACDENDDDVPPGGVVTGAVAVTGPSLSFVQNEGDTCVAAYVTPKPQKIGRPPINVQFVPQPIEIVDPATLIDILRERGLGEQLARVREAVGQPVDEIERLVGAASAMTKSQLKSAVAELKSIVSRGEAGLKSLQAQAEKQQ